MSQRSKDLVYVFLQGILFLLFIWSPFSWRLMENWDPGACSILLVGLSTMGVLIILLSMLQMSSTLSPFPTPKKEGQLIETGMFKFARHPIYSGIMLTTCSWSVCSNSMWQLMVSIMLLLLFYFKSSYEERLLVRHYPEYPEYKRRTGRFFPKC